MNRFATMNAKRKIKSEHKKDKSSPSSLFFSSLSPEQQKQFTIIVGEQHTRLKKYYDFKRGLLFETGFILFLWGNRLFEEVVKPTLMSKSMWRLLIFVWALKHTQKYKDEHLTRKIIITESQNMGKIQKMWPMRNLIALEKYGWLGTTKGVWNTKRYFITEQSRLLIHHYSLSYSRLFDEFFLPSGSSL